MSVVIQSPLNVILKGDKYEEKVQVHISNLLISRSCILRKNISFSTLISIPWLFFIFILGVGFFFSP